METRRFAVNEYVTSEEIKNARKKLGLTQKEFAQLIGSSKPTVERWERENTQIKGPIILLLQMIRIMLCNLKFRQESFLFGCGTCIRIKSAR